MIFTDIFNNDNYNMNIGADSIIVDIGMNVGIATLFFALKQNVKKIYSYEPDPRV